MGGSLQENHRKVHGDDRDDEIDFPFDVELQSAYAQIDYRVKETINLLRSEALRALFGLGSTLKGMVVFIGNKDLEPDNIVTYDKQIFL